MDPERRLGMLATCAALRLRCERVVPPDPDSQEVQRCMEEAELNAFQCSLVLAHRGILSAISSLHERAIVFEDDARLNSHARPEEARQLLASAREDFVMGGWCHPSCAHAYIVSPEGARGLLRRGFAEAAAPADCMFPHFEWGRNWSEIEPLGGKLLFPKHCANGYEGDIGLFCQDRSTSHSNAYHLLEYMSFFDSYYGT